MKIFYLLFLLIPLSTIAQEDTCQITAPNVMTFQEENGSDHFGVWSNCELTTYELTVYNRWGQKVFESSDLNIKWDGKLDDHQVPSGTYMWMLSYTTNSKKESATGQLSVIR